MNPTIGLTGRVKAFVVNNGEVVSETDWTKNLWLDSGLDRAAAIPICDVFSVAAKGEGSTSNIEDLTATANRYAIGLGAATLTRTAGTRNFTTDDIGKLIRFNATPFAEYTVVAINSTSSVEVTPTSLAAATAQSAKIYAVDRVTLDSENGRTELYSNTPGENSTTTLSNTRTFKRTFLFPPDDVLTEYVAANNTFSQSGFIVTRVSGTRDFTDDDIGGKITFRESGNTAIIQSVANAANVTVDVTATNAAQKIILAVPETTKTEVPDTANRYSLTTDGVLVRNAGARNFTSGDVGKIMYSVSGNFEFTITSLVNSTTVTTNALGSNNAGIGPVTFYGFTDYREIGFSDSMDRTDNIYIRVVLTSPVRVYVATKLRASDQLKLAYECKLTVTPNVATTRSLASVISDPTNAMSGNKNGSSAIESFATSTILPSGETDITFADLEPFFAGFAAWSLMADALAPLTNKIRDTGTVFVPLVADSYIAGTFAKTFQANFGLNDAINNSWRTLMTYDPDSKSAIYSFLFATGQKKDGEHTFQISFKKTWNRDLS